MGTAKTRRTGPNHSDFFTRRLSPLKQRPFITNSFFGGITLQFRDGYRLFFHEIIDTGTFTEFFYRTYPGAATTHDIRLEDGMGRTFEIIGTDLFDKLRHIDARGTAFGTG